MDYLGFDLRLSEWDPSSQSGIVEVLQSPAGEGERYPFVLAMDLAQLVARTERSATMAIEVGQKLAASILSQESLGLWRDSYQMARERGRGLRLRLNIDSWELARLPWELLYDSRRGEFLVFDPIVSVVRYLRLMAMPPSLRHRSTLKVLVVAASPRDLLPLDWEREMADLREAMREMVSSGQIELQERDHVTHEKLLSALQDHAPDVLHYVGHGAYDPQQRVGSLFLENEQGDYAICEAPQVARLLRRFGVTLVVLNACETAQGAWSGLAPALVRADIPAVVAMQWAVEDQAAIRFGRTFYRALALGRTIDECVAEGRIAADAVRGDPNDWAAPVLFLRSASGQLWTRDIARLRAPARAAPQGVLRGPIEGALPSVDAGFHFKTRGPLLSATDAELIVDRTELRRALRLAQQPSVTQYIAFQSARQTGKTTLLFQLMERLGSDYPCIFVDLSVLRAQDARAAFRLLAFEMVSKIRALLGEDAFLPEIPGIESSVDLLEFLTAFGAAVPVPRIIILLDEVGALSPEASDCFFNTLRTVFTQGRAMNSALSKYLFVFSGAVDLHTLTSGANSPLNICEKIYLKDLELADVEHIVAEFIKLGVQVSPDAHVRAYEWAAGHPYLTMRLASVLEHAEVRAVTAEAFDMAAEHLLVEDDNIQHAIRQLDARPLERRRLRSILLEGRRLPFSRNDPVLASLEMIGVIRGTQPCEVRNRLYERALREYYAQLDITGPTQEELAAAQRSELAEATFSRLEMLRADALDPNGCYREGQAWESFAAALFSMVPAFSVYPEVHTEAGQLDLVLDIHSDAPDGSYWSVYQPRILVEPLNLAETSAPEAIAALVRKAQLYDIKLVFVMTSGGAIGLPAVGSFTGSREGVTLVQIDDAAVAQLIAERRDLDAFLRSLVLDARLHRI